MVRKKRCHVLLFILIMMNLVLQGFTQTKSNVAVVNYEKAFQNSEEGRKAIIQLREKEQKINDELTGIDKQVQALEARIETQKLTLTFETQQQLLFDLDRLKTKRKRVEEDSIREYRQLQFSLFSKVRNELLPIINNVAKEREFSLVIDHTSSGVLYFNPDFDITEEVIKRYNASKNEIKKTSIILM